MRVYNPKDGGVATHSQRVSETIVVDEDPATPIFTQVLASAALRVAMDTGWHTTLVVRHMTASGAWSDLQRYFVTDLSSGISSGGRVNETADEPLNYRIQSSQPAEGWKQAIESRPAPDFGTSLKSESLSQFPKPKPRKKHRQSLLVLTRQLKRPQLPGLRALAFPSTELLPVICLSLNLLTKLDPSDCQLQPECG